MREQNYVSYHGRTLTLVLLILDPSVSCLGIGAVFCLHERGDLTINSAVRTLLSQCTSYI